VWRGYRGIEARGNVDLFGHHDRGSVRSLGCVCNASQQLRHGFACHGIAERFQCLVAERAENEWDDDTASFEFNIGVLGDLG